MATFKMFEEINAWKNGRALVNDVYAMTGRGTFAIFKLISSIEKTKGTNYVRA